MKQKNLIIVVMVIAAISLNSCRKVLNENLINSHVSSEKGYVPNGGEPGYAEFQLKYIAKTLPWFAQNVTNFKINMHNQINGAPYKQKFTRDLQTDFLTMPFNFVNSVSTTTNLLQPTNYYDSSFFFEFEFDDCLNKVVIKFNKNSNTNNYNTKPLVACAVYETTRDTIKGYFLNTVTNTLDSLDIHADNEDDYYLWVVTADNMCLEGNSSTSVFSFNPEGHCGDGDCQPWLGETPENCPDCSTSMVSGNYTLVLEDIQHLTDKKIKENQVNPEPTDFQDRGYHESAISGKYDIFYSYAIVTTTDGTTNPYIKDGWWIQNIVKRAFARDWYEDNNGYETKKWTELMLIRLKPSKDEVKQEREVMPSGNLVHNTTNTPPTKNIHKTLSYNFNPKTDRIYVDMLEWDRAESKNNDNTTYDEGVNGSVNINFHYKQRGLGHLETGFNFWTCPYYYGYLPCGRDYGIPGIPPSIPIYWIDGDAIYGNGSYYYDVIDVDPNNSEFQDFGLSSDRSINLLNSEMRTRYVLYPNP